MWLLGYLEEDILDKHLTIGVAVDFKSKMMRFYNKQKVKHIMNFLPRPKLGQPLTYPHEYS